MEVSHDVHTNVPYSLYLFFAIRRKIVASYSQFVLKTATRPLCDIRTERHMCECRALVAL